VLDRAVHQVTAAAGMLVLPDDPGKGPVAAPLPPRADGYHATKGA
jgi:hypothetical protein